MDHTWIIDKFGGARHLSTALGHRWPTTVQAWKERGVIPLRQIPAVLSAAKANGIELKPDDFFGLQDAPGQQAAQ